MSRVPMGQSARSSAACLDLDRNEDVKASLDDWFSGGALHGDRRRKLETCLCNKVIGLATLYRVDGSMDGLQWPLDIEPDSHKLGTIDCLRRQSLGRTQTRSGLFGFPLELSLQVGGDDAFICAHRKFSTFNLVCDPLARCLNGPLQRGDGL